MFTACDVIFTHAHCTGWQVVTACSLARIYFHLPEYFYLFIIYFKTFLNLKSVARQATLLWVFSHPSLFSVARGDRATVKFKPCNDYTSEAECFVTDSDGSVVLGLPTSRSLILITIHCEVKQTTNCRN